LARRRIGASLAGVRKAWIFAALVGCSSSSASQPVADGGPVNDGEADSGSLDASTDAPSGPVVSTDKGAVRGVVEDGVQKFWDIPYAAPPTGALRWKPPQPRATWSDVRDGTQPGVGCPQGINPLTKTSVKSDEDCLALNVFTADTSAKKPVMVFIHGGSFVFGAGNDPIYDGAELAKRGVVVVTINYRLGALGFLGHPLLTAESENKASGNYGLLDQQAALAWVKTNAEKFGGDPANVTVFGESAGAISVCLHVVSPLGKGLFHRALSESGTCTLVTTPLHDPGTPAEDSAEERGKRFMTEVGCSDLACLRAKPVDDLLAKQPSALIDAKDIGFAPNIDGYVVPSDPRKLLISGPANDVPYLFGSNADEGSIFAQGVAIANETQYEAAVRAANPAIADELLKIYPASEYPSPKAAYEALLGEGLFNCPARASARAVSGRAPAYLYHFEHPTPIGKTLGYGVFHASELWFVFGGFANYYATPTGDDKQLSDAMGGYWTRFAETGDPNGDSAVMWPRYDTSDTAMILDVPLKTSTGLLQKHCDALDALTK
jgi:para-nitrobenzyl esterase